MADIEIGCPAIERTTTHGKATLVNKGGPANGSGVIIRVEIYANTELIDAEVATFFVVSGNNLSTRDDEGIGNVAAGSKQTFTVSLDVQTGDYIGINFFSGGDIWADATGGEGLWRFYGDKIPCANQAFDPVFDDDVISLYGTSVAPPVTKKKNVIFMGSNL